MNNKVNLWAILLAFLVGQGIYLAWFYLLADRWLDLNGLTPDFVAENQGIDLYITGAYTILLMTGVLAWLFRKMKVQTAREGLWIAAVIGFVFTYLPNSLQDQMAFRPSTLRWVEGGVYVLIAGVVGLILGAWTIQEEEE
ncbi:MAG: DUF1761 domain-containing protein [Bacteroidota bacterium]